MLLLVLVLVIQCCIVFGGQTSGSQFISYHIYGDGQTSSSCYPSDYASKWAGYITANTFGLPCGTCVQMTSAATGKTIYAYAIDIGGRGFDLNLPAFCELAVDEGGLASGGCNVNWQVVDASVCSNWIKGKTKPNCNPCPAGSTCGNFDPNRNGGVNWATYCPTQIALGSGVSMTRCEMRVDGCTCTGGSSSPVPPKAPTAAPTVSPKAPTAPTGSSGGKGKTATRCGADWGTANSACNGDCQNDGGCATGQKCFASLDMTPCGTSSGGSPPTASPKAPTVAPKAPTAPTGSSVGKGKTATRCGADWGTANSACYGDCQNDGGCPSGQHCWASLSMTPCSSSLVSDASSSNLDETGNSNIIIIGISVGVGLLLLGVVVIAIIMVKRRRMEEIV